MANSTATPSILFVGNSYTQNNRLPDLLKQLAESAGLTLHTDLHAAGGMTLARYTHDQRLLAMLAEHEWTAVVLQEQSIIPALEEEREAMHQSIRFLDWHIRQHGAKTLLFLTWGRQQGLPDYGFTDFRSMQEHLDIGYQQIATELGLILVPVGRVWEQAVNNWPNMKLWSKDGSHPSLLGSYLAACVFFAVLYGYSPVGKAYPDGLTAESAKRIQNLVAGYFKLG